VAQSPSVAGNLLLNVDLLKSFASDYFQKYLGLIVLLKLAKQSILKELVQVRVQSGKISKQNIESTVN